jgi:HEAT repeat protein
MRWLYILLLKKSTGETKFNMAATIAQKGNQKYQKPLLKLLKSSNTETRYAAAFALGRMKDKRAFEPLVQMHNNPGIPIATALIQPATSALVSSVDKDDPAMLKALMKALGRDSAKRYYAAISLKTEKSTPALLRQFAYLAVHDGYHEVRKTAYDYLKEKKALDLFAEEIQNTDLDTKITTHKAGRIELEKRDIEELAGRLEHRDPRMRKHAADFLKEIEWEPEDKTKEARWLVGQQNWKEAQALGPAATFALIEAIRSKIDYGLTGKQGSWNQDLTFNKNLSHKEKERLVHMEKFVQTSAANALVKMRDKAAVEALVSLLDDKDNHTIILATSSLGTIGDPAAVTPIVNRLEKWNKTLNNTAAVALGKIGGKEAVDALIKLLKHESHHVRSSAIKGLAKLKDDEAVAPLCDILLSDMPENEGKVIEDESNICEAAKALGEIGSQRAVKALSKAISVRYLAFKESVTALVAIGGPEAKAALENTFITGKPKQPTYEKKDYGYKALFLLTEYCRGWGAEASEWIFCLYQKFPFHPLEWTMEKKIKEKIQNILIAIADVRVLGSLLESINATSVAISALEIAASILEKNAKKVDTEILKEYLKIPKRKDVSYRIDREYEEYRPYGLYTNKILRFADQELERRDSTS